MMFLILTILLCFTDNVVCQSKEEFKMQVDKFGEIWKDFAETSLGATFLQSHFDDIINKTKEGTINTEETFNKTVHDFERIAELSNKLLEILRDSLKDQYVSNIIGSSKPSAKSCCGYTGKLVWSNENKAKVDVSDLCEITGQSVNCKPDITHPFKLDHKQILPKLQKVKTDTTGMSVNTYIGTKDGYFVLYPAEDTNDESHHLGLCDCLQYDPRYRPWYVDGMRPKEGRAYVLAVDFVVTEKNMKDSGYLKNRKALIMKVVNYILRLIHTHDKIVVMRLYGNVPAQKPDPNCFKNLLGASPGVKDEIREFFADSNFTSEPVKYRDAFTEAYNLLKDEKDRDKRFFFVSNGYFAGQVKTVGDKIEEESKRHNCSTVTTMVLLRDEQLSPGDHGEYTTNFIDSTCKCSHCSTEKRSQLILLQTGNTDSLIRDKLVNALQQPLKMESNFYFSHPYKDSNTHEILMDACMRSFHQNQLIGISCISYWQSTILDTSRISNTNTGAYAFLLNSDGIVFIHPLTTYPALSHQRTFLPHIKTFETSDGFSQIFELVITLKEGRRKIFKKVGQEEIKEFEYFWKKVNGTDFIMVLVSSAEKRTQRQFVDLTDNKEEVYHRIDQRKNNISYYCRVINQLATKEAAVIKISSNAFKNSSYYYLKETPEDVSNINQFLSHMSTQPPNEIFEGVERAKAIRQTVTATNIMLNQWRNDGTEFYPYSLWRYVGAPDGTYRIYPGTRMNSFYDPRKRPWYKRAIDSPSETIITAPYQDAAAENTIIVTIAKALKYSSNGSQIAGVIGGDFTIPYFQHKLFDVVRMCRTGFTRLSCEVNKNKFFGRNTCMVIDRAGLLLFHPRFIEKSHFDEPHLAELEPELTSHLLQKELMTKHYCLGYNIVISEQTAPKPFIRYFYSLENVKQSTESGNDCWNYLLQPVNGINLIVVLIRDLQCKDREKEDLIKSLSLSCYCPKKKLSGCVASHTKNMKICECPCYDFTSCSEKLPSRNETKLCPIEQPIPQADYTNEWTTKPEIPSCTDFGCNKLNKSSDCESRFGCEWCVKYCNGTFRTNDDKFCGYNGKCCEVTPAPSLPPESGKKKLDTISIVVPIVLILLFVVALSALGYRCHLNKISKKNADLKKPQDPEKCSDNTGKPNQAFSHNEESNVHGYGDVQC